MIRSVFYKSAIYVLVGLSLTLAEEVALTEPVKLTHCAQVIGINGSAYQSFVGIPFAEPPINTLRFAVSFYLFRAAKYNYTFNHDIFLHSGYLLEPSTQGCGLWNILCHNKSSAMHPDELSSATTSRYGRRGLPLSQCIPA